MLSLPGEGDIAYGGGEPWIGVWMKALELTGAA